VSALPVAVGGAASALLLVLALVAGGVFRPSDTLVNLVLGGSLVSALGTLSVLAARTQPEAKRRSLPFGAAVGIALPSSLLAIALSCPTVLIEARVSWDLPHGNLKTLSTAQTLFREADKESDGNFDYGTLAELGETDLVSQVLASGTKGGYLYAAGYGTSTSEFLWYATAKPQPRPPTPWYQRPGPFDRYYATNHEGVIYWTTSGPIPVDPADCAIPPGPLPLGR
jgi:hypothetical protein